MARCDETAVVDIPPLQQAICQSESVVENRGDMKEPPEPAQNCVVGVLASCSPKKEAPRENNSVRRQAHLEIVIPRLPVGNSGKKRCISKSIINSEVKRLRGGDSGSQSTGNKIK